MSDILDLPDVLRAAGLPVAADPGWERRGRTAGRIRPRGVLVHDDVIPERTSTRARLRVLRDGRPDLRGPLCHVSLAKDGTWHLVAAGRANHAGAGIWQGVDDGNGQLLGVECAWFPGEGYPDTQIDSLVRGVTALCRHFGWSERMVAHHYEYARPLGRKADMHWRGPLREAVALHLLAPVDPGGAPRRHHPRP